MVYWSIHHSCDHFLVNIFPHISLLVLFVNVKNSKVQHLNERENQSLLGPLWEVFKLLFTRKSSNLISKEACAMPEVSVHDFSNDEGSEEK